MPSLTTKRAVEIYQEMLWIRRELYDDGDFFTVPDAWERICEETSNWKVTTYRTESASDFKPRAGIVVFGDKATLTTDERLWEGAKRGGQLYNFILAHEIGHLALDHHASSARTKNFQLHSGQRGMSILPPDQEELEANIAAVFFQCGVALADKELQPVDLAKRAHSDVEHVRKAQRYVQLEVFQRQMLLPKPKYPRVVL